MRTHTVVLQQARILFWIIMLFENDLYVRKMITLFNSNDNTILENYNCILEKDNAIFTIIFFFTI